MADRFDGLTQLFLKHAAMFLSNRYRPNKWPFYVLVVSEFPFTVALLALFGIADPDLYRTLLWQDGADNGFNSSPNAALYAAANYRPYTTPKVWSQLYVPPLPFVQDLISPLTSFISITNYNVVIVVLSMFILLAKVCQLLRSPRLLSTPLSNMLPSPLCTSCMSGPHFSPPSSTARSLRSMQSQ